MIGILAGGVLDCLLSQTLADTLPLELQGSVVELDCTAAQNKRGRLRLYCITLKVNPFPLVLISLTFSDQGFLWSINVKKLTTLSMPESLSTTSNRHNFCQQTQLLSIDTTFVNSLQKTTFVNSL